MSPVALRVNKVNLTTALNGVPGEGDGEEREGEEGEEGRREEGGDGDEGEGQREEEDVQVEQAAGVGTSARLDLDGAETEGGEGDSAYLTSAKKGEINKYFLNKLNTSVLRAEARRAQTFCGRHLWTVPEEGDKVQLLHHLLQAVAHEPHHQ